MHYAISADVLTRNPFASSSPGFAFCESATIQLKVDLLISQYFFQIRVLVPNSRTKNMRNCFVCVCSLLEPVQYVRISSTHFASALPISYHEYRKLTAPLCSAICGCGTKILWILKICLTLGFGVGF